MTGIKAYGTWEQINLADTPSKREAVRRKLIMDIENMVEETLPNALQEQSYIFTRLFQNINARVLHEKIYEQKLNHPERLGTYKNSRAKKSRTNKSNSLCPHFGLERTDWK